MPANPPVFPDTPGNRRLLVAIVRNDPALARRAFAEGAVPDAMAARGEIMPLLNRAVSRNRDGVVDVILEHGGDPGRSIRSTVHNPRYAPLPPTDHRPAFVIQAASRTPARVGEWLAAYPSCRAPGVLAAAMYATPKDDHETYALLMAAARAQPSADWGIVVGRYLARCASRCPLERFQDLWGLAPPGDPGVIALALTTAISNRKPDIAMWLLDHGADPLLKPSQPLRPFNRICATAREAAITSNQPAVLARIDDLLADHVPPTLERWVDTLVAAITSGSRQVFRATWRSTPSWPLPEKRAAFGARKMAMSDSDQGLYGSMFGAKVSPLVWAVLSRGTSSPALVREIIQTETTTRADRTDAAHGVFLAFQSWDAHNSARILEILVAAGIDWVAPSPAAPFHSLEATARSHVLASHPMVANIIAACDAEVISSSLPGDEPGPRPSPVRLRL